MATTATLDVGALYADGTTLNAYSFGPYADNPDGTAPPTATATGSVSGGSISFSGLTDGTRYYAGTGSGPYRYFAFSTSPAATGGGGGGGSPSGSAGGVLGGSYPNPSFAQDMATQAELDASAATKAQALTATAVKTANYTAAAGELVPVDATAGSITITLPTAPADKTRLAVKAILLTSPNVVTVACAGSDTFNRTGGATSFTLQTLAQGTALQYVAATGVWMVVGADFALSQLDARFAPAAVSVKAYGAKGDGRVAQDVTTTASSQIITSTAQAAFTQADVGKKIIVRNFTSGTLPPPSFQVLVSSISSVQSGTQATLANQVPFACATAIIVFATDDTVAINAAIAAVTTSGGTVEFPGGIFGATSTVNVPANVTLHGGGADYGSVTEPCAHGSVLSLLATITSPTAFVTMSSASDTGSISGFTRGEIRDMSIDANNLADTAVKMGMRRARLVNCTVWRGQSYALRVGSQNGRVINSVIGNEYRGTVILVENTDVKIWQNEVRGAGTGDLIQLSATAGNTQVHQNHLFSGVTSGFAGSDVFVKSGATATSIVGNSFDSCRGPQVTVQGTVSGVTITGNLFFEATGFPSGTYAAILLDPTTSTTMTGISIVGNVSDASGSPGSYTAIVERSVGAGTLKGVVVRGNVFKYSALVFKNLTPDVDGGGNMAMGSTGTTLQITSASGTSTFSGDGSTTAFSMPHGMVVAPTRVRFSPGSVAAAASSYWTANATNIIVTFLAAPAAATNNVVLSWEADA